LTKIGIDEFGEYLSLLSPQVTKGFVSMRLAAVPNKVFKVETGYFILIVDGKLITTGVSVNNYFLNKNFKNPVDEYLEGRFSFDGCNTKISGVDYHGDRTLSLKLNTGISSLAEVIYKVVDDESNVLGIMNTCKYHTKYCTGSLKQYDSEAACNTFLKALPKSSSVCGLGSILSGNTSTCRYIYHLP
jgi:hypothetical protein